MPREKRIQISGYHYITTNSVDYKIIFIQNRDYAKFLSIIEELSKRYNFVVHSYTILVSSYHILIRTYKNNLSTIVKLLNSNYSKYFNQRYGREGALWRSRYKSYFISERRYLPYFIKYIIWIPKLVGVTGKLHLYYHSSYRQFIGLDRKLPILEDSFIFSSFNSTEDIKKFFLDRVTKDDIEHIHHIMRDGESKCDSELKLESFFSDNDSRDRENRNILKAYRYGFSQRAIAKYLNMTQQAIQKRLKGISVYILVLSLFYGCGNVPHIKRGYRKKFVSLEMLSKRGVFLEDIGNLKYDYKDDIPMEEERKERDIDDEVYIENQNLLSSEIEERAKNFLGTPYVWGAVGPNKFDCSGFTKYIFKEFGINIPRVSREQAKVGRLLNFNQLEKGDLVFFDGNSNYTGKVSHVGIYLGDKKFIHASSKAKKVLISTFKKKSFYKKRFLWGRRLFDISSQKVTKRK